MITPIFPLDGTLKVTIIQATELEDNKFKQERYCKIRCGPNKNTDTRVTGMHYSTGTTAYWNQTFEFNLISDLAKDQELIDFKVKRKQWPLDEKLGRASIKVRDMLKQTKLSLELRHYEDFSKKTGVLHISSEFIPIQTSTNNIIEQSQQPQQYLPFSPVAVVHYVPYTTQEKPYTQSMPPQIVSPISVSNNSDSSNNVSDRIILDEKQNNISNAPDIIIPGTFTKLDQLDYDLSRIIKKTLNNQDECLKFIDQLIALKIQFSNRYLKLQVKSETNPGEYIYDVIERKGCVSMEILAQVLLKIEKKELAEAIIENIKEKATPSINTITSIDHNFNTNKWEQVNLSSTDSSIDELDQSIVIELSSKLNPQDPLGRDWYVIGQLLNIPSSKLSTLKNNVNIADKFQALLSLWPTLIETDKNGIITNNIKPATIKELCIAFKSAKRHDCAKVLKKEEDNNGDVSIDEVLQGKHLIEFCENFDAGDWKKLARMLLWSENVIDLIKSQTKDYQYTCKLLQRWKKETPENYKISHLIKILDPIPRRDMIKFLCEIYPQAKVFCPIPPQRKY